MRYRSAGLLIWPERVRAWYAVPAPPTCAAAAGRVRRDGEGFHGLIYPSVRNAPGGVCVVLFLERTDALIELEPVGEDEWEGLAHEGDG